MRADRDRRDRQAVAKIAQHWVRRRAHFPLFAPLAQRQHGWKQIIALGCEPVFDPAAIIRAVFTLQNARLDQPRQAVGENVARDTERLEEFLKVPHFVESGAQDHE